MLRIRPVLARLLLSSLLLGSLAGAGGCRKQEPPLGPAGTPQSPRRVELTVSNQGFQPARIRGRPGETLTLVVRYDKSAGECGREIVLPAQKVKVTLTEQQPAEIALTLPAQKGEVSFTCGMDMLRGSIVVE
jgi:plastocyanin domain-containing protein